MKEQAGNPLYNKEENLLREPLNSFDEPHSFEAGRVVPLTLEETMSALTEARRVLLLMHVNPDGDAVGSAFALKALLCAMGKEARCVCAMEPPKRLRFLYLDQEDCAYREGRDPSLDCVSVAGGGTQENRTDYDLICSVDVASPGQLGALDVLLPKIGLMIDHHGTGEPFAPYYVDAGASASGEIVFRLYRMMRQAGLLSEVPEAARRMYAAILSDTGSFKFSNTTPETHRAAAELVGEINGAHDGHSDAAEVARTLFGQRTLKELIAQMHAIRNLRFYADGALGVVLFTQEMLRDADLSEDEIGSVVDTPRSVEGVVVGVSIRQMKDDLTQFKVSSRANAACDVASVCARFGGGGHVRAAGCTVTADSPEEALAVVVQAFSEAVEAYREQAGRKTTVSTGEESPQTGAAGTGEAKERDS